jgi:glutaredoxin 3
VIRVHLYSTTRCAYCVAAKNLLRRRDIAFEEIDVTGDHEKRDWLVRVTGGHRTVPVIFIDDTPIGGYQELAALDGSGELARRLSAPPASKAP